MTRLREQEESEYRNPASRCHFPLSNTFGTAAPTAAQSQRESQSSGPSWDLGLPNWLLDDRNTDAVYSPLPVFSPGIFIPGSDGYWDCSDSQFKPESQQTPLVNHTPTVDESQEDPHTGNNSYVPFALISAQQTSLARGKDNDSVMTDVSCLLNQPSPPLRTSESARQSPSKAPWGDTNNSRQSPISSRSPREKHPPSPCSRASSSGASTSTGLQLRGVRASHKMKVLNDANTEGISKLRTSHNLIEKQYRTRLNTQFTDLLDATPPRVTGVRFDGYVDTGGPRGKVSKGDVLEIAKRYIQTLEQDKRLLEEEAREDKTTICRLRAALVQSGFGHID